MSSKYTYKDDCLSVFLYRKHSLENVSSIFVGVIHLPFLKFTFWELNLKLLNFLENAIFKMYVIIKQV